MMKVLYASVLLLSMSLPVQELKKPEFPKIAIVQVKPLSAKEAIAKWAKYYKVNQTIAFKIARAESKLNCRVRNTESSAAGLFQFVDETFINTQRLIGHKPNLRMKLDCSENAQLACFLLSRGEFNHWDASREAWDENWIPPTPMTKEIPD